MPELSEIPANDAAALCERVLRAAGAPPSHATVQTSLLIEADLRGRPSHGLQRLPTLVARIRNGVLAPGAAPRLTWRTDVMLDVDGADGFGPVAAFAAADAVAARARRKGVALAAVRNSSHVGMLAPYVESLAEGGVVGIALTTSEALVHPPGGRTALLGTNPIGVGVPSTAGAFVLDMSTAAISAGEIIAHEQRHMQLPPGRAVDAEGLSTTDPTRARAGAISPFGGPKGYGLGLAIELIVALLSRTALGRDVTGTLDVELPATKGDVFLAIDPTVLGGDGHASYLASYLEMLRLAPTAPGVERVRIPGDRMREERAVRVGSGIRYPQALWLELLALDREAGGSDDA
jgi:LDH2 family malate/lactate/ureidoglycolate dehydrogenase